MVSSQLFLLLALLTLVQLQPQSSKLIFIQSIIRHGARNPYQILNIGDQYAAEQQSLGQLTSQGKAMHFNLGKKMYEVYWKRLFEGTQYQHKYHQSRFWVESTDVNRTIQSAQSHLYGILSNVLPLKINSSQVPYSSPPYPGVKATSGPVYGVNGLNVHPIPIHVYGRNMSVFDTGDFLTRFLPWECPNQNKWEKENYLNPKYEKMLNNQTYIKALSELSKSINKTITVNNFTKYYDNLICMQYRGVEVPSLISEPSQTKRALQSLYSLSSFIRFYSGKKQIRASANDLFIATINNMKAAIQNLETAKQWVIYSAHDITIGIVMAMMEMSSAECIYDAYRFYNNNSQTCVSQFPNFASSLVFELYQNANSQYTFKVNYNGVHRKIPLCGNKEECTFKQLVDWHQTWKVKDIKALCGVPNYYTKQSLIVLGSAILVSLLYWMLMKLCRNQSKGKTD